MKKKAKQIVTTDDAGESNVTQEQISKDVPSNMTQEQLSKEVVSNSEEAVSSNKQADIETAKESEDSKAGFTQKQLSKEAGSTGEEAASNNKQPEIEMSKESEEPKAGIEMSNAVEFVDPLKAALHEFDLDLDSDTISCSSFDPLLGSTID